MKIGIITHYDVHNHGALLQLNALIQVLRTTFDADARALQYDKNYDFLGHELKAKYVLSFQSVKIYLKYLFQRGIRLFLFNLQKKKKFENFKCTNTLIGDYYSDCPKLDAVIIGSDEVFALHTGPTPVLFGHGLPTSKVFSYAGCFGPTTLEDINKLNCEALVSSGLNKMQGLGMRDENSCLITKSLTSRSTTLNVDPVILYGYKSELEHLSAPKLSKYLLVYAYETRMNDAKEVAKIKTFAQQKGLLVVCAGFYHKWADKNINTDPIELLRYFKFAEMVVTDTFHGCVLSLITQREVAVKLRDNSNKLLNLLQEYKIEDRIIDDNWDLSKIFANKENQEYIAQEITRRRHHSMEYLTNMINS